MITNKAIDDAFAKATEDMNKAMTKFMVEEMRMWITKTPEEYRIWRERRNRDWERKDQLERCRRSIAELEEKLAYEEKSLAYLEDYSNYK